MLETQKSETEKIFAEIFAKQSFLFPEPIAIEAFGKNEKKYLMTSLTFKGKSKGGMALIVTENLARELAANTLGVEVDDAEVDENLKDAIGECLNMLCGHVLTTLEGGVDAFDLSAPKHQIVFPKEISAIIRKPDSFAFAVDEEDVLFQVTICQDCNTEKIYAIE